MGRREGTGSQGPCASPAPEVTAWLLSPHQVLGTVISVGSCKLEIWASGYGPAFQHAKNTKIGSKSCSKGKKKKKEKSDPVSQGGKQGSIRRPAEKGAAPGCQRELFPARWKTQALGWLSLRITLKAKAGRRRNRKQKGRAQGLREIPVRLGAGSFRGDPSATQSMEAGAPSPVQILPITGALMLPSLSVPLRSR